MTIHSEFDTSSLELDGVQYKIKLLNTSEAFITGQELIKLTLPSAGALFDGMSTADDPFKDQSTFTAIAFHIVRQLGDVDTLNIVKKMLSGCTADDKSINFETHFRGKLNLLAKLTEFALKENFGSLFIDMGLKERLMSFIKGLAPQTPEQPLSAE